MKIDGDELINAVGDDTLHNIVVECANNAGVSLTSGECATLVEAAKQGIRDACDEVSRTSEVQQMIARETRRFFRQIGGRPNGYRTL